MFALFVKNDSIVYILDQLKNFHERIQFTYEVEDNNKLPFLDVLLIKNANNIHCMKSVQIRSFFCVNLCIQPEYGKIRTRKNSVFGHFSHSDRQNSLQKTNKYRYLLKLEFVCANCMNQRNLENNS